MQPFLEKVPFSTGKSIYIRENLRSKLNWGWHYHPEFEFCLTERLPGKRFVGNCIERFEPGDLLLLGENLPHAFVTDQLGKNDFAKTTVVQFSKDIFGDRFLDLPEMDSVNKLLLKASYGLQILGQTREKVQRVMRKMDRIPDYERLIALIDLLHIISSGGEYRIISSDVFKPFGNKHAVRTNTIIAYVFENFQQKITLQEIADLVNMTKNALCKYFKNRTNRTLFEFLSEVRIAHSCKLLLEGQYSINQIAEQSGFNNLSHFNRQFKKKTGQNPSEYVTTFNQHLKK